MDLITATVSHFEYVDPVSNNAKFYRTYRAGGYDGIVAWGRRGAAGQIQVLDAYEVADRRAQKEGKGYKHIATFTATIPSPDSLLDLDNAARILAEHTDQGWADSSKFYADVPTQGQRTVIEVSDLPAVLAYRPYSPAVAQAVSGLTGQKATTVTGKLETWVSRNAVSAPAGFGVAALLVMPADTANWLVRYGTDAARVIGAAEPNDDAAVLDITAKMKASGSADSYQEALELARLITA